MGFTFNPGVIAALGVAVYLYSRAVRILGGRGYAVPGGQQAAFYGGLALNAIALLSPVDGYSDKLLIAHMSQHLLIGDLAAPLLLVGIRSPVYAFFLPRPALVAVARRRRLRAVFRWLRQPLVAVPVWIILLYGWHFAYLFVGALRHDWVHLLQHESFVFGALLVWWSVIEPKKRRMPGDLWKIPYLLGARIPSIFLGMAFILMRSPAYGSFYGDSARDYGLSPLTDQQVAGGVMMGLDVIVMLFVVCLFFYRSSQDHDRAEQAAAAAG